MNFDQMSEVLLLADLLFGVNLGVVASAVHSSRREERERSMLRTAPDAVCAGVRVLNGLYTRDDGYLQSLLSGGGATAREPGGPGSSGSHGKKAGR